MRESANPTDRPTARRRRRKFWVGPPDRLALFEGRQGRRVENQFRTATAATPHPLSLQYSVHKANATPGFDIELSAHLQYDSPEVSGPLTIERLP